MYSTDLDKVTCLVDTCKSV